MAASKLAPIQVLTDQHQDLSGEYWSLVCTVAATLVYELVHQAGTRSIQLSVGDTWNVDGKLISWVALDINAAAGGVVQVQPGWTLRSYGTTTVGLSLNSIEQEGADVSVAAATGDTALITGLSAIPKQTLVRFNLACGGPIVTSADAAVYCRIIGATSGVIYAEAVAGSSVSGSFRMKQLEHLNVTYRNADTVAHWVQGSFNAWGGE